MKDIAELKGAEGFEQWINVDGKKLGCNIKGILNLVFWHNDFENIISYCHALEKRDWNRCYCVSNLFKIVKEHEKKLIIPHLDLLLSINWNGFDK